MSDVGFGDARVIIKIEVNDSEANRKLTALAQRMRDLDGRNRSTKRGFDDTGRALDRTAKSAGRLADSTKKLDDKFNWFGRRLNQLGKDLHGATSVLKVFGAAFSGIFKILKYGAIEIGLMSIALGGMVLALKTAELASRAWSASVKAMGGAAGVAVAAIATVMAAVRELQVAQMKPLYTGPLTLGQDMSALMGNKRLAMYGESLNAIAGEQLRATGRLDAQFQQRLVRMADFAMGDPKTLQAISAAFGEMQKQGKVTTEVYSQLQSASPALAKAFEELVGGQEKAAAAAAKGTVPFLQFERALLAGKLNALQPFNGALDDINDTLIGRLKGSLIVVKEELTQLGMGFLDMMKGPLAQAERDLETFFMKITPTLRKEFPRLFESIAGDANGLIGGLLDKLATSINTNMANLVGMGDRLADGWGRFREFLRDVGAYLREMSGPFSILWNAIIKPFGQELATTFNYALKTFGDLAGRNSTALYEMGNALRGIFEGVRGLISMFATFKELIQPFVVGLLKFLSMLGQVFNSDTFIGALMRFAGIGLILLALFKKFIFSLGMMKENTLGFVQIIKNLGKGQLDTSASTNAASAAQNKQTAAVKGTTAAMQQMLAVMKEIVYYQKQMALAAGIPAFAAGAGRGGGAAGAGTPPAFPRGPVVDNRPVWNPNGPMAQRAWAAGGLSAMSFGLPVGRQAERTGRAMGKGFAESKTGRAIVGAGFAGGMAATMVGGLVSSKTDSTNKAGQALGGALSMGGTGAMLGSAFGPWGTIIGGLGGLALGGITGWMGAGAERKRQAQQGRDVAGQQVAEALGTGNRAIDYVMARDAITAGRGEIDLLRGGGSQRITELEKERSVAVENLWTDFSKYVTTRARADQLIDSNEEAFFWREDETKTFGENRYTNAGRDDFNFVDKQTGYIEKLGDMEADLIEGYARDYAMEKYGFSEEAVRAFTEGNGGSNNAFFLEDIVKGRYNDEIAATNKQIEALKAKYGDFNAADQKYREELDRVSQAQDRFNKNMDEAVHGLGLNADDVSALFDELGFSLSEAGVGIHEFNKLLGYTGDAAADAATAAGRLRDTLLGPVDAARNRAEAANEFQNQMYAFYETRGKPISDADATIMAANTLEALVDNELSRVLAGEISFDELLGTDVNLTGISDPDARAAALEEGKGSLRRRYEAILATSPDLPPELLAKFEQFFNQSAEELAAAMDNPFERAKIDSQFATRFTAYTDNAATAARAAMDRGVPVGQALDAGVSELERLLENEGIKVTPETRASLESMLGNTILNSADAIEAAFNNGSTDVYNAIRAALTGGYLPGRQPGTGGGGALGVKVMDTHSPRGGRFGDSSNRFRKTMGAHAMFNSRFGGRRSVTSGVRDFALGSLNSDHTTGAAFDLVGDNLLGYGKDVRDSGGFAEMHGGPDNRHLHVVPNVGDSYSPKPAARNAMAMATPTAGGPVTINVYGAEGQSVQALADEVMDRIERKQRSDRERY